MSRFIETIQLLNGEFQNLILHQHRVNRCFEAFYAEAKPFHLEELLSVKDIPESGRFKCTLYYSREPGELVFKPYTPKKITRLVLKEVNQLDYSWKYADRSQLNDLLLGLYEDEEIIIVQKGYVTDSSYANLAFFDGSHWWTPSTPLLNGIKRQKLLNEGRLFETKIQREDIQKYSKCCLINAMLDPGEVEVEIFDSK